MSGIPPLAFIGGLYMIHVVMCSKLAEVHAKKQIRLGMKIWYFCELLYQGFFKVF